MNLTSSIFATFFVLFFTVYWMLSKKVKIIVDYDDAVFHQYDLHRNSMVRLLLANKIDKLMQRADVVVAGNEYLAARARKANCKQVEINIFTK